MKLWLFHLYAIPPTEAGITRHYQLACELKKRGHAPVLIAGDTHHRREKISAIPEGHSSSLDPSHDVPILWLRTLTKKPSSIARVFNMWKFAWRIFRRTGFDQLDQPDIIMGCTPDLFSAFMAQRLAKKMGVPFVFHVGEIWPLMLTELGNIPKWHPFIIVMDWLEKYLYRNADGIITPQPRGRDHITGRGGDKDKISYIPNGVDLDIIPSPPPCQSSEKFHVMYIGAMGKANGMDEILDAARLLKEQQVTFSLMGTGPFKERLVEEAKMDHLDNVSFPDPVSRTEIYKAMQNADAFIVNVPEKKPYSYGLAHNKIYDYMAMGRPTVLATHAPDDPITEYNAGILVPANDSIKMAAAIEELAALPAEDRLEMGIHARKGVEEKYNFTHLGSLFETALLDSLARYQDPS